MVRKAWQTENRNGLKGYFNGHIDGEIFMKWKRFFKHLLTLESDVNDHFSELSLAVIKSSVAAAETHHSGEIRFIVEAALPSHKVLRDMTPRQRALEIFSQQRMWDTQGNNGVLIYLLIADRSVEIVADRGIHEKTAIESWQKIIDTMQEWFAIGRFEAGAVAGIEDVSRLLSRYFPASAVALKNENSLDDMERENFQRFSAVG